MAEKTLVFCSRIFVSLTLGCQISVSQSGSREASPGGSEEWSDNKDAEIALIIKSHVELKT
jgi:hypothetical protein